MKYEELDLIILKNIISSKKIGIEFAAENNEKIFSPDLWRFTKIILEHIRVYKDIPTKRILIERANKNEPLANYINETWDLLDKIIIDEKEFKHNLEKIKKRFTEQLIIRLKDSLFGDDKAVDIKKSISELSATLNHIKGVNAAKAYSQQTIKECLPEFRENYKAKLANPEFGAGIKTGIGFFDFITAGLSKDGGELLLIGSESNGGKSMLLLNIAFNMWIGENTIDTTENFKGGEDVIFFSLEMGRQECMQRFMARAALVPQFGIRDANLKQEDLEKVGKTAKFINSYNREFHIIDMPRGCTMTSIELIYNDIVATSGRKPKVIVIDYLTLMECEEDTADEQDWLRVGALAALAHEISRQYGILVLTATQLNRAKPGSSVMSQDRVARSSLQAANANFIILIEKRPNEQEIPTLNLALVKNRRGPLANGVMYKQLDCCALHSEPLPSMFSMEAETADISDNVE